MNKNSPKRRGLNPLKYIIIGLSILLAIPVVLLVAFVIYINVSFEINTLNLNKEASSKAAYLSGLTIVDGRKIDATPQVRGGDLLTRSSDPNMSTSARASLNIDGTFSDIEATITKNLKQQGYNLWGQAGKAYYSLYEETSEYEGYQGKSTLTLDYRKGEDVIEVVFVMRNKVVCPPDYYNCHFHYTNANLPNGDVSIFNKELVGGLKIVYANRLNFGLSE